jgi:pimeloyl-ACP methyl ester carboxylesterase
VRSLTRRIALVLSTVLIALGLPATATAAAYPIETTYSATGPYATTTGSVTDSAGNTFRVYRPSDYAALGSDSPIVTWGNGTNATPEMYSRLLTHLASHGFTVIASTLTNTGSGKEIAAGARYLVAQNGTAGSVFNGNLDVNHVAAIGHSQGAGGATRAATNNPTLVTTLMTFSLPNKTWVGANPNCPTAADCMYDPSKLTQPAFLTTTRGGLDSVIASPATQKAFYDSIPGRAALGIILNSEGRAADHNATQDAQNPGGLLGYTTAWLNYQLRGDTVAAGAFTGTTPELVSNTNWPSSATK